MNLRSTIESLLLIMGRINSLPSCTTSTRCGAQQTTPTNKLSFCPKVVLQNLTVVTWQKLRTLYCPQWDYANFNLESVWALATTKIYPLITALTSTNHPHTTVLLYLIPFSNTANSKLGAPMAILCCCKPEVARHTEMGKSLQIATPHMHQLLFT